MSKASGAKRKPSREQARVWLSTVLSPMLNVLSVELQFVERRNWSFRCDSQDFEYLCPIAMMVAVPNSSNLAQVFRYYPSLRDKAASHDRELTALRKACRTVYGNLIHSPRFQGLPVPSDGGADNRKYFAEYVINGLRDLLSYYSFADFWKTNGAEYLKLRSDPSLDHWFESLDTRGNSFKRALLTLTRSVKQLQERIADEAGLAPTDPSIS